MKSTRVAFVNPVARHSYQGRHTQSYIQRDPKTGEITGTSPMNRSMAAGSTVTLSFNIDKNRNKLVTGLDEVIDNPLKGQDRNEVVSKHNLTTEWDSKIDFILDSDKITLQTYYEILAGVNPDTYTSNIQGDMLRVGLSDTRPELTELQKFKITLYPRSNRFTSATPRGRLALQLLKYQRRIAKSIEDVNSAIHLFYISEENEAEERALARKQKIAKGFYNVEKLNQDYTPYERFKVATVLKDKDGRPIISGIQNDTAVKDALFKYVDDKSNHQVNNIEALISRVDQLSKVETADILHIDYVIQQAIHNNVIIARDGEIIWASKREEENVGSFSSMSKLKTLMMKEYEAYSPKGKETNYYGELLKELNAKNVWIE